MPRGCGLCHVALSISCLSPMARRPVALFAMKMASLILRPDLRFLTLTSFQSFNRPSLSFGSSSRISLHRQLFSVSRPRLRPPGNIHNRSRLLLTNQIRPRFAATSFDDFAIIVPHRQTATFVRFYMMFPYEKTKGFAVRSRGSIAITQQRCPKWVNRVTLTARRELPFFPDQRTSPIRCVRSEKCHEQTWPAIRSFCWASNVGGLMAIFRNT